MSVEEREKHTETLPRVRIKPSQLKQLHSDAAKRGYGRKIATYIRTMLFGGKLAGEQSGMPIQDVIRNVSDLGRMRQHAGNNPALLELIEQVTKRHMSAIHSKP